MANFNLKLFAVGLLVTGLFTGCGTTETKSTAIAPDWYGVPSNESLVLHGYGTAPTLKIAKANAQHELISQIETNISSECRMETRVQGGNTEQFASCEIKSSSSQRLRQIETIKTERGSDGRFFIALRVDLRPIAEALSAKILKHWGTKRPGSIQWQGPEALTNSRLIRTIERAITDKSSHVGRNVHLALNRVSGRWVLQIDRILHTLNSEDLLDVITLPKESVSNLSLEALKLPRKIATARLKEGDTFIMRLNTKAGAQGYFAMFNLYADGRVSVLQDSTLLKVDNEVPSKNAQLNGEMFQAALINSGEAVLDTYIAIQARQPIATQSFPLLKTDQGIAQGERAFQLDRFIEWMGKQSIMHISHIEVSVEP